MKSELDKLVESILKAKLPPANNKPGQTRLDAPFLPRVYTIADFHTLHRTIQ